ncbi:lipopolysaccharide/colanic/teichoic acid biosynthesis glycosyltransferase [Curtobacterium flaccumfaciens]|uniref:Lipopolysaccharide/colanic/teichoic acid biosynthesis glycosyltransferase n=1 Tax=Curtobacterium salicis TaxID=1779862 RepID=A0ABX0TAR2_9MICO|nr:sugar transferase [Curtobacterium sp. WW7]NII40939.1 lipopolysaccharide/colanic/teichoic acid biosynthesis glycosyltransferase [Curtobacterium sp. WW7]
MTDPIQPPTAVRPTTTPWDPWKRAFDIATALLLLAVAGPLMLVVAVLIRCSDGGPAIYRQMRPGVGGRGFEILKFRSMRPDDELERLGADADHMRITRLGHLLRATSIDELPNLVNVLRGEMSIVGPRPHLMSYLDLYSDHQSRRHEVRPGITGLAQVRGRNALDWQTRLDLDVEYVDNRSALLDARILVATVAMVLSRRGVSARGHATMPLFEGNHVAADAPAVRETVGAH